MIAGAAHSTIGRRAALGMVLGGIAIAGMPAAQAESRLERGRYLMSSIVACGNCHTPKGPNGDLPGMELAGGLKIEDKPFTVFTPNITMDKATGIGKWTDAQIIASIREGKRPDARSSAYGTCFGFLCSCNGACTYWRSGRRCRRLDP